MEKYIKILTGVSDRRDWCLYSYFQCFIISQNFIISIKKATILLFKRTRFMDISSTHFSEHWYQDSQFVSLEPNLLSVFILCCLSSSSLSGDFFLLYLRILFSHRETKSIKPHISRQSPELGTKKGSVTSSSCFSQYYCHFRKGSLQYLRSHSAESHSTPIWLVPNSSLWTDHFPLWLDRGAPLLLCTVSLIIAEDVFVIIIMLLILIVDFHQTPTTCHVWF